MFILRTLNKEGIAKNEIIGKSYTVIRQSANKEHFDRMFKQYWNNAEPECCYAFIEGEDIIPLFKDNWNYIMTETGKTFENVSFDKKQ